MNFVIFLSLVFIGYMTGRSIEKAHYRSIQKREDAFRHIPMIASQWRNSIQQDQQSQLFGGGVVVGADYFKAVVAGLRNLFGGRMGGYESLLDRGRREAILRMQEKAQRWGAEKIINVRVETAVIGNQSGKRALPCVEIYAYGTALKTAKNEIPTT